VTRKKRTAEQQAFEQLTFESIYPADLFEQLRDAA